MATYLAETYYVTWGGRIGSATTSQEIWQCGVHFAAANNSDLQWDEDYDIGNVWTALSTAHKSAEAPISSGAVMEWVKLAHIGKNGLYRHSPIVYAGTAAPGNATPASGCAPQLAMCVTLWSGETLGKGNYGRFYLPWPVATIKNSDGHHMSATAFVGTWQAAIFSTESTLRAETGSVVSLVIPSQFGTMKPVTEFRVGDVVDTQRRRRNRLGETYSVTSYR